MKYLKNKYVFVLLAFVVFLPLMVSCVDDFIDDSRTDKDLEEMEGAYLTLRVALQSMSREGTAAFEDLEDYINTKDVHLLFFYANDAEEQYNRLFKHFDSSKGEISFIPISNNSIENPSKYWYVRIPASDENFATNLRYHNFKIAALVNWRLDNDITFQEERKENGVVTIKGDHIKKLHHLTKIDKETYNKDKVRNTYSFLFEGYEGAMGWSQQWVKSNLGFSGEGEAEPWIRENFKPGFQYKESHYDSKTEKKCYTYEDLRLVWNFNGAYSYKGESVSKPENYSYDPNLDYVKNNAKDKDKENVNAKLWAEKNSDELYSWLYDGEQSYLKTFEVFLDKEKKIHADNGHFKYIGPETKENQTPDESKQAKLVGTTVTKDGNSREIKGILLPPGSVNENVFKMIVPASGHLYIKGGKYNDNNGKLSIELRNEENSGKFTLYSYDLNEDIFSQPIKITGDSEYLSIYCSEGKAIVYEIEFIQDIYLYETDRSGIPLSLDPYNPQLIPMYGIQTFKALGNLWKEGTVFDLSNFNNLGPNPYPSANASEGGENSNDEQIQVEGSEEEEPKLEVPYEYKDINLLRSVAKVVLKIPISMENHHHVYLRSLNRTSRCEPMDVSTPTDEIWLDDATKDHNIHCEWENLKGHEPFYKNATRTYQEMLAWYYGSWASGSSLKLGEVSVPSMRFGVNNSSNNEYPHIINPMINRSDFAEFIYTGEIDNMYHRYVLYVPEKFVDDPNDPSDLTKITNSSPKICHIEFREESDSWINVDDNNCFRIYFTEGGHNDEIDYPSFNKKKDKEGKDTDQDETWENTYENDIDNLKKHWPIMRNHVYNFTVQDANKRIVIMNLEVLPWKEVNENNYNW